jgi:hypothetical protein
MIDILYLLSLPPSSRPSPSLCWEKVAEGRMREGTGAFFFGDFFIYSIGLSRYDIFKCMAK